jgi:hypothetical protein
MPNIQGLTVTPTEKAKMNVLESIRKNFAEVTEKDIDRIILEPAIYPRLKSRALELIRETYPDATEQELDHWIINTGYGTDAPKPYENIRSLIYVYAANLLNAGLRGPDKHAFGRLASTVIANHYLSEGTLTPVEIEDLAAKFLYEINRTNIQLTRDGNQKYLDDLNDINKNKRSAIRSLLLSLISFCNFLRDSYQSSAANYHKSFLTPEEASFEHVSSKLEEIIGFRLVGVAVGMNFMKDSQMPAVADRLLESGNSGLIQYLVKPDMHVMRFMLYLTGRYKSSVYDLYNIPSRLFTAAYVDSKPSKIYQSEVSNHKQHALPKGEVLCINDIYCMAESESIPPIYIDRILYLFGSGSFKSRGDLRTPRIVRYRYVLSSEYVYYREVFFRLRRVIRLCELKAPKEVVSHEERWLDIELERAEAATLGSYRPYTDQQQEELDSLKEIYDIFDDRH